MKIAVSTTEMSLAGEVGSQLGQSSFFVLYDTESREVEMLDNTEALACTERACVAVAQHVAHRGARVVMARRCGPLAYRTLTACGVRVITGVSGTVSDAIAQYLVGGLRPITRPDEAGAMVE